MLMYVKNSMFGSKGKGTLERCHITNAGFTYSK